MHQLEDEVDWLCRAADAFQKVVLCTSFDAKELGRNLASIPPPASHFQRLVFRCFMLDSFSALVSSEIAARPLRLRDLAPVVGALRLNSDSAAGFSKLVTTLFNPLEEPDLSLAEEIGCRVEREYASRMTSKQMACEYKVSPSQLDRSFLRRFGLRFHEYLTMVRMRHGIDLVCGGMKVEAAAQAVGYRSKKDFFRTVKLHTGLTPAQLRRQRKLAAASWPRRREPVVAARTDGTVKNTWE